MFKKMILAATALFMLSCGGSKKEETEEKSGLSQAVENAGNLNKMASSANKMEELSAKLKKLTPLNKEQLKAIVPEMVADYKRKSYSAGNYAGTEISTVEAEYTKGEENKYIKINILDGAGESGSAIISLMALGLNMDTESESDGKISKTVEIEGVRYSTEDTKQESTIRSSLKFIHNERYSVSLDGEGYNLAELQAFLKKLDLSSLK